MPAGDDSDDGEEEAALIKAMRAQQRRLDARGATRRTADDDDLDASASDSDDEAAGIRGSKKDDFYGDDDVDHEGQSDEEERADEEREARRLQRAAADGMDAGDFDAFSDESDEDDDASDSERETLGAKARALANQGAEKKKEKKEKKSAKNEGAAVESLGRDAVAAAASDAVASDAPELIALTKELTKTLDEITQSVEPVIAAARAGELATAEGISYLDAKHLLMLSYCINIVFYLLLKSEGRSVRDHPVVLRLVEIRAYLEKLRPIDRKLKYQIDKLLKMADGPRKDKSLGEGEDEDEDDPLRFRPNPDALVGKADEEDAGDAGGAYRPPKMVPTAMDDFEEGGKSAKQKRKEKEARRRASRSALIKVRLSRFRRNVARLVFWFGFFPVESATKRRAFRFATQLPRSSARFRRRAAPWRSKATISRGTERTYQILGRVPPSTPWATIQSRAGQSFFFFFFFFSSTTTRGYVPPRDARSPLSPRLFLPRRLASVNIPYIRQELAQELGEAPEELGGDVGDTSSAFAKREFARMEARAKIEEDLFTRVPLSKTERRRAKATTRSMNSLANVGDFGDDVADLVEVAEELEGQRGKRQRLVDSVTLASGSEARKNQKPVSGEQDVPLRDSLGVRVPRFFSPASSLVFLFFYASSEDAFLFPNRPALVDAPRPRAFGNASFEASMTVLRGHSASKMMPDGPTRSPKFGGRGESPPPASKTLARRRAETPPNMPSSVSSPRGTVSDPHALVYLSFFSLKRDTRRTGPPQQVRARREQETRRARRGRERHVRRRAPTTRGGGRGVRRRRRGARRAPRGEGGEVPPRRRYRGGDGGGDGRGREARRGREDHGQSRAHAAPEQGPQEPAQAPARQIRKGGRAPEGPGSVDARGPRRVRGRGERDQDQRHQVAQVWRVMTTAARVVCFSFFVMMTTCRVFVSSRVSRLASRRDRLVALVAVSSARREGLALSFAFS